MVLGPDDGIPDRSFANLPAVQTIQTDELNAYDVLKSDWVVFTDATLPGDTAPAPEKPAPEPQAQEQLPVAKASATEPAAVVDEPAATGSDAEAEGNDS